MGILELVDSARKTNDKKLNKFESIEVKQKVGILGGTFDPIHFAHLATAEFIRDKYDLDWIFFIPTGNPPHKLGIKTDKYDRYNMVLLATKTNNNFIALDIEIERNTETYTVDTLKDLKKKYPNTELYFITGADAICEVESWREIKKNFEMATFIAATRPGISLLKAQEKIEQLERKYDTSIISVYVPSLDISSTYIREQIEAGKTVRYLMPESVEKYMQKKDLYKQIEE